MHSHFGNGILRPGEDDTIQVLARHLLAENPLESIENTRTIVEVVRGGRRVDRASLPVR